MSWRKQHLSLYEQVPVLIQFWHGFERQFDGLSTFLSSSPPCANWHLSPYGQKPPDFIKEEQSSVLYNSVLTDCLFFLLDWFPHTILVFREAWSNFLCDFDDFCLLGTRLFALGWEIDVIEPTHDSVSGISINMGITFVFPVREESESVGDVGIGIENFSVLMYSTVDMFNSLKSVNGGVGGVSMVIDDPEESNESIFCKKFGDKWLQMTGINLLESSKLFCDFWFIPTVEINVFFSAW